MPLIELPPAVAAMAERGPDWQRWVAHLPRLCRDQLERWALRVDAATVRHGHASVVLTVRTDDGTPAVLKVGFPDEDSEYEHLALRRWGGDGAVRLLRADPTHRVMLLERLRDIDLTGAGDVEACATIAALYPRLHVPAPPQLRTLSDRIAAGLDALTRLPRSAAIPRRLVEQATTLAHRFAGDPATDGTTVHTDLHYANVLAADREPWLAIDPKPISGDPHYEVAPLLWNRWAELRCDVRGGVRRRFELVVDAAGLDADRARDWVVLRMVVEALDALGDPRGVDPGWLTRCVTLAKAVQ